MVGEVEKDEIGVSGLVGMANSDGGMLDEGEDCGGESGQTVGEIRWLGRGIWYGVGRTVLGKGSG